MKTKTTKHRISVIVWFILLGVQAGQAEAQLPRSASSLEAPPRSKKPKFSSLQLKCQKALPPLAFWIKAWERRSGYRRDLGEIARQSRRARRASWLPQLMLSAEQRQQHNFGRALKTGESLDRDERRAHAQVFRGRMSWDLTALLDPPGSNARLQLRHRVRESAEQSRMEIALRYAELLPLLRESCALGLDETKLARAEALRALLEAQCGQRANVVLRARSETTAREGDRPQPQSKRQLTEEPVKPPVHPRRLGFSPRSR